MIFSRCSASFATIGRGAKNLFLQKHERLSRRTFFASSTDHTRLLKEAEVHRLEDSENVMHYVLVGNGMDLETVKKVPQLHLGRLTLDLSTNTIFGVKVVNKTLGDCQDVCNKLLEMALVDARQNISSINETIQALATLHGVSEYVLNHYNPKVSSTSTLHAIATNQVDSTSDAELWEDACKQFLIKGKSSEAKLYESNGGILSHIEHGKDTGDYANTCAGSMAIFQFS